MLYGNHEIRADYAGMTRKQLLTLWAELIGKPYAPRYLLSQSAKTIKSEKRGILTGIIYMSPAAPIGGGDHSCTHHFLAKCSGPCLARSGHGGDQGAIDARADRLALLIKNPSLFFEILKRDIAKTEGRARRKDLDSAYRLNGTTDLAWYKIQFGGKSVFEHFPNVQWYDYTKNPELYHAHRRLGVDVTFSYYRACSVGDLQSILDSGGRVAIAYYNGKPNAQRIGGREYPVIDGDEHDARFLDRGGCFVGLDYKQQTFTKQAKKINRDVRAGRSPFIVSQYEEL